MQKRDVGNVCVKAVRLATENGHREVLKCPLDHGADIERRTEGPGYAPLQSAAGSGQLVVVEYLVAHGAVVDSPLAFHGGRTALQAAAGSGHLSVVEYLLAQGAVVDAADGTLEGRTAWQAAADNGHLAVVEYLLAHRADLNAPPANEGGFTALSAAVYDDISPIAGRCESGTSSARPRSLHPFLSSPVIRLPPSDGHRKGSGKLVLLPWLESQIVLRLFSFSWTDLRLMNLVSVVLHPQILCFRVRILDK